MPLYVQRLTWQTPAGTAAGVVAEPDADEAIAGASACFLQTGGHSNAVLASTQRHTAAFDAACAALVGDMQACGWCGRVAFGGSGGQSRMHGRMFKRYNKDPPCALTACPLLHRIAQHPEGSMWWWACNACHISRDRRTQQQEHWQAPIVPELNPGTVAEVQRWLEMLVLQMSLPAGAALQAAVLKTHVRFSQAARAYVHALEPNELPALLSGPLITWENKLAAAIGTWDATQVGPCLRCVHSGKRSVLKHRPYPELEH
jgi:hypothetical protein